MLHALNAWSRYLIPAFSCMHLMTFVWLVFTFVLFVIDPAFLHRWFRDQATRDCEQAFRWLHVMHWLF